MKRRLALLLALSLTFAAFPVTGVGAAEAETPAAVEQTVEETAANTQEETEAATENEEADTAKSEEAAVEAASTEEPAAQTEAAADVNEDALLVKHAMLGDMECVMAIICDGMGGLDMGELASSEVIRTFERWFTENVSGILGTSNLVAIQSTWVNMLKSVNGRMMEYSYRKCLEIGTTFTGLLIIGRELMAVHVGDSRIYHIEENINQLTEDHTFVAREVKRGNMTPEEAETDMRRNLLLQCVGASADITPQIIRGQIMPGTYMLCSDGFRHEISPEEMLDAFSPAPGRGKKAMQFQGEQMVKLAKDRGESDNISIILIGQRSGKRR